MSISEDILKERMQQKNELGYTESHDDKNTPNDWVALVTRHAGLAVEDGKSNHERWRRQMVRVAAIAIAALESHERSLQPWRTVLPLAQRMADLEKSPVLVVAGREGLESRTYIPYLVLESAADSYEKNNAVQKVLPTL